MTDTEIEVYEGRPPVKNPRGAFDEKNQKMTEMLMRVPSGKSIRVGYLTKGQAVAHAGALRHFIRLRRLHSYIVAFSTKPESDAKFYVYLTRKP